MSQKLCFSFEEDEKLVEAISPHPGIYDLRHPLHKDQRAKEIVWAMVSEEVGRSVADCKKRWRNIKDTHDRRERKHYQPGADGSEAPTCKKVKKWQLQKQLSFLHTVNANRKSVCNANEDTEGSFHSGEDDSVGFNSSEMKEEPPTASATVVPPQTIRTKKEQPKQITAINQSNQATRTDFSDKLCFAIEKRSKERRALIENLLEKNEETDDVTLFFKSIAKSVQKMPLYLQHRAKLETLNLIINIESEMYASHQGTSENTPMCVLSSPSTSTHSDGSPMSQDAQT